METVSRFESARALCLLPGGVAERSNAAVSKSEAARLGQGVHPKIVSEMLGHSTIAITLDLYSHVTPTMQREAAHVMDAVLGRLPR